MVRIRAVSRGMRSYRFFQGRGRVRISAIIWAEGLNTGLVDFMTRQYYAQYAHGTIVRLDV